MEPTGRTTAISDDRITRANYVRDEIPPRRFEILQRWEGVVVERTGDDFTVELRDLTSSKGTTEIGELCMNELSEDDRSMVREGAVLYWNIGYETSPAGSRRRVSDIRFRRSPVWTCAKLSALRERGKALFTALDANV